MAALKSLILLSLAAFGSAKPRPRVVARQIAPDTCNSDGVASLITTCLRATGTNRPAYLTQLCSAAPTRSTSFVTTVTRRPRTTTTITAPSSTVFDPTTTATITSFSTIDATTTVTSTVNVTSGTSEVFLSTTTLLITSTSYDYTCSSTGQALGATSPATGSASATSTSAEATPSDIVVKRQRAAPACAREFQAECGNSVLRQACGTLGVTPPVSVITATSTVFSGSTIVSTTTITSGVSTVANATTITETSTTTNAASSTETITNIVPFTPGVISTTTISTTTTITTASPVPSSFRLLVTNSSGTYAAGSRAIDGGFAIGVPGTSARGDNFRIDSTGRLVDLSTLLAIALRYITNVKPYLLQFAENDEAIINSSVIVPVFSACSGQLFANYAGGARSQFGICDGVLSLGSDGSTGLEGCDLVTVQLDPASVNATASALPTASTTDPAVLPTDTDTTTTPTDTSTTSSTTSSSSSSSSTSSTSSSSTETSPTPEPTVPAGGDGTGDDTTPPTGDDGASDNSGDTTTGDGTPPA